MPVHLHLVSCPVHDSVNRVSRYPVGRVVHSSGKRLAFMIPHAPHKVQRHPVVGGNSAVLETVCFNAIGAVTRHTPFHSELLVAGSDPVDGGNTVLDRHWSGKRNGCWGRFKYWRLVPLGVPLREGGRRSLQRR